MQNNSNLKEIADAITNNGEFIKRVVTRQAITPKWWQFWIKPKPEESENIYLRSATMATMFQAVAILSDMEVNLDEALKGNVSQFAAISKNKDDLIKAVAIMIHNDLSTPPTWLTKALKEQFAHEEFMDLSARAYRRLGVESFFGTLTYLNVTKAIIDPEENEAHGELSEE